MSCSAPFLLLGVGEGILNKVGESLCHLGEFLYHPVWVNLFMILGV